VAPGLVILDLLWCGTRPILSATALDHSYFYERRAPADSLPPVRNPRLRILNSRVKASGPCPDKRTFIDSRTRTQASKCLLFSLWRCPSRWLSFTFLLTRRRRRSVVVDRCQWLSSELRWPGAQLANTQSSHFCFLVMPASRESPRGCPGRKDFQGLRRPFM
jgi:hypothetical protein